MLASGKADNYLSQIAKNVQNNEKKTLKINFEPDAPYRLGTEIKVYEPGSLAELDTGRLESIGGDQIKKNIKILNEELKKLGQNSLDGNREALKHQVIQRVDQEAEYEQFTEDTILEITEMLAQLFQIESERNKIANEILEEEKTKRNEQIEINTLKGHLGGLNRDIIALKAERIRFKDIENSLETSKRFYSENLLMRENLEKKFQNSRNSADTVRKNSLQVVDKLEQEENYYKNKLKGVLQDENSLIELNVQLKSALSELKVRISQFHSEPLPDPSESSKERYSKLSSLDKFHSNSFEHDQETKLKIKSSLQSKHLAYNSLLELYKSLESKHQNNLKKHLDIYLKSNDLIYLEQTCCIQGDLSNLTESLNDLPKLHNLSNKSALKTLDSTSTHMLKETDNIRNQCNKINEIMASVTEKDEETDRVKCIMAEIKERHPPYIPKLDDPIDIALFEFIKSSDLPIPIPFTREEPGVYLFGTKRVFLKLENGNIVIRIGGGYTNIQNFIEIYTPIELERQEEAIEEACPQLKSSLARFTHTPQKGMSPQRAARILQGSVEAQANGTPVKQISSARKTPNKK